jgi:predicted nucleic acid-binding protein
VSIAAFAGGPQAEANSLRSFGSNGFHMTEHDDQDIRRMAELVEAYLDLPLGIVDPAVVAITERLKLTEIATLDHRHFAIVQPNHTQA